MQYTIRNIPKHIDRLLRAKARTDGKSLNEAAVDALQRGLGAGPEVVEFHDLDWFFGGKGIDKAALRAIAEADVVHPDDWK